MIDISSENTNSKQIIRHDSEGVKYVFLNEKTKQGWYDKVIIGNKEITKGKGKGFLVVPHDLMGEIFLPEFIKDNIVYYLEKGDEKFIGINKNIYKYTNNLDMDQFSVENISKKCNNNLYDSLMTDSEDFLKHFEDINRRHSLSYYNGRGFINVFFDKDYKLKVEYNGKIINDDFIEILNKKGYLEDLLSGNLEIKTVHYDNKKDELFFILSKNVKDENKSLIFKNGKEIKDKDFFLDSRLNNTIEFESGNYQISDICFDQKDNLYYKIKIIKYTPSLLKNSNETMIIKNNKIFQDDIKGTFSLNTLKGELHYITNHGTLNKDLYFINNILIKEFKSSHFRKEYKFKNGDLFSINLEYSPITGKTFIKVYKNDNEIINKELLFNRKIESIMYNFNLKEEKIYIHKTNKKTLNSKICRVGGNDEKVINLSSFLNGINLKFK